MKRLFDWLIYRCVPSRYLEEFEGDLEEMYQYRLETNGKPKALLMHVVDTLHLVLGFGRYSFRFRRTFLLSNVLKTAWRNALRQRQYAVLNVFGLALGIFVSLFIGLYVHHEFSYDSFLDKNERIYRINQPSIWEDWDHQIADTGPNVATAIKEDIPEFEQVTRLLHMGSQVVRKTDNNNSSWKENHVIHVEENFLEVFSFDLQEGDRKSLFRAPYEVVLTRETADRYFGFKDVVGKQLEIKDYKGDWIPYRVAGVINDVPDNSHIQFDMLISMQSEHEMMDAHEWKWIWTAFSTYGLLAEDVDPAVVEAKLQLLPPKWAPPTTERIFNQTFDDFTGGKPWLLTMQPVRQIYLSEEPAAHRFGPSGNKQSVIIFIAVGILVLLLSSINFMNLATARGSCRSKEVGVRKVLGSRKSGLVSQFIGESTLYVLVSAVLALMLLYLTIPWLNTIAQKDLDVSSYLVRPEVLFSFAAFIVVLGGVAGCYPAFYLARYSPVDALKQKAGSNQGGSFVRNGLIIFQFTISITLMICAAFVQRQLQYTSNFDVGFDHRNVLQLHNIEQFGFDTESIKNTLLNNAAVSHVGKSFGIPPEIWSGDRYKAKGRADVVQLSNLRTEGDYLELLGVEFLAGRNFDKENLTDRYKVILNEEAVKVLGWSSGESYQNESPVGKIVKIASGSEDELEVLGVVADFNFTSVKRKIAPLIILNMNNDKTWDYGAGLSFFSIRFDPEYVQSGIALQQAIGEIESELKKIDPSFPFEYSFLDQGFEDTFRTEQQLGKILNLFTVMAFVIAALGLFGLAAFTAERRVKELGIRKVIGASTYQLVLLFSSEFGRLIAISIFVAIPFAYLLVQSWLSGYATRTPIAIEVFILVALSTLVLSLVTISLQSFKAASRNPVDSLRDD